MISCSESRKIVRFKYSFQMNSVKSNFKLKKVIFRRGSTLKKNKAVFHSMSKRLPRRNKTLKTGLTPSSTRKYSRNKPSIFIPKINNISINSKQPSNHPLKEKKNSLLKENKANSLKKLLHKSMMSSNSQCLVPVDWLKPKNFVEP